MTASPPTFRFAPSPNGRLHAGHALSALVGHELARRNGGRFLVRIEDIDPDRSRESHVASILDDLGWLGLSWEEPVMRQSVRFQTYGSAIERLRRQGVLYPCWASRREVDAFSRDRGFGTDPDGAQLYPGIWRDRAGEDVTDMLSTELPHAMRIDMAQALRVAQRKAPRWPLTFRELSGDGQLQEIPANPEVWGDAIIVRKDTPASYVLAVVVDDAAQGVTHVTRGMDLQPSTGLQRLLQVLLDLPEPVYHHHRLVTDAQGRKLSKSENARALAELRAQGVTPAELRSIIGFGVCDVPDLPDHVLIP
ncbi:MAG: tRNA glutamyl-Q(34) synthetase GluQRS [Hyphomicrobium sp.]|nr:tRNA glutamyl-Q(34) synthetase GluQRS [Hyphomicrobium sp.]